jgi:hypothetical protein
MPILITLLITLIKISKKLKNNKIRTFQEFHNTETTAKSKYK